MLSEVRGEIAGALTEGFAFLLAMGEVLEEQRITNIPLFKKGSKDADE